MAKILIVEGDKVQPLDEAKFALEGKLQDYLESFPSLIPLEEIDETAPKLVCIGKEVGVVPGAMDLLFIDANGILTVVETKLAKSPEVRRTVIGQIIEYASYVSEWSAEDVYKVAAEYFSKSEKVPSNYRGGTLDEAMEKFTGEGYFSADDLRADIEQNLQKGNFRLIIAVDELVEPLRKTVTYLNSHSDFNILLLLVKCFEESESRKVLIPTLFGYKPQPPTSRPPRINEDIFLARCREGEHKGAEELYFKAKALQEKRRSKGDSIRWGVSGHSYHVSHVDEVVFVNYSNGGLSLWLYVVEKYGEAGQRYLEKLRSIADFSGKVDDYKRHKEPYFSTDKMTSGGIGKFISAVEELGEAFDAEATDRE